MKQRWGKGIRSRQVVMEHPNTDIMLALDELQNQLDNYLVAAKIDLDVQTKIEGIAKRFNTIIEDHQSSVKLATAEMMKAIVDVHDDYIIVTDINTGEIIFKNKSVYGRLDYFLNHRDSDSSTSIFAHYINKVIENGGEGEMIYHCTFSQRYYEVSSSLIELNNQGALVHYISDITKRQLEKNDLSEFAYKDDLTNVYNRRFTFKKLNMLLTERIDFSLVVIDIDGLKRVNDQYGHIIGDQYLKTVVQKMKENLRDSDFVGRIGGDEFIVILPSCSEQHTSDKLAKINTSLNNASEKYPMSISYGILHYNDKSKLSIEDILVESDRRMYVYKERHRRVMRGES